MLDREAFLRPIAHRGFHSRAEGVVENTIPAFEAAIAKGYGIECDLRPAADGLPLVFHDETLDRLTEGSGPVARLAAGCAARLPFKGAKTVGIPSFADLLALVAGRAPLFAEVKSEWTPPDRAFLEKIATIAKTYHGPLALMSFDPDVMKGLKDLAPDIPRGIVSGTYFDADGKPWWPNSPLTDARRHALANLEISSTVAPDFYAYDVRALPSPAVRHVREVERRPVLAWTVRTARDRRTAAQEADAAIFEGYKA